MIRVLKISGFLLVLTIVFGFAAPEKKLNKLAAKIWKDQTFEITQMPLPDSLKSVVSSLYRISADGETLGYGCYTTAYGCRVGGCAAPATADGSYETFDYMVIYDSHLKIIQVDIADYGGQYGYEICRAKWLEQFAGKTNGFKLNENIDGITGATVSATFLIDDLNAVGSSVLAYLQRTPL